MTFLPKKFVFRATFGVALFFALNAFPAGKTETYQDIIEKAYNLSLQKDRAQAINLLVNAAKKESKKGKVPIEILNALDEVSTVFFSDKAQQLHELALSLWMNDPNLATQKLADAARLEAENQQIQLGQIRLQIGAGDCASALKAVRKDLDLNPYSEELKLDNAQATLCTGTISEYQVLKGSADPKRNGLEVFWQALDIESAYKASNFVKGRDLVTALAKADPGYPESNYWLWKFGNELKTPDERSGQKYLVACKSLSSRASRKYLAEPRLCRRTSEVEAELKKTANPGS
jgi:predicted Zn-dependent protease